MLIFLLLLLSVCFCSNIPIYTIVFVTPAPYIDSLLLNSQNKSKSIISNFGERQAYLIGRELRYLYNDHLKLLDSNNKFSVFSATNKNSQNIQTLSGILSGLFPSGSGQLFDSVKIQQKSLPPINPTILTNWSSDLRDFSLIHNIGLFPNKGIIYDYDIIFDSYSQCPGFYNNNDFLIASQHNSCNNQSLPEYKACKQLYKIYENYTYNETDDKNVTNKKTCRFYEAAKSAIWHNIPHFNNITSQQLSLLSKICENYYNQILGGIPDSDENKFINNELLKLVLDRIIKNLNRTKWNLDLYALNEFHMKSLLLYLTENYHMNLPKYGNTIILDIFPAINETYNFTYVQLSLNKQIIKMRGQERIPLENFTNMIESGLLSNFNEICFNLIEPDKNSGSNILYIIIISCGVGAISIAFALVFILCICRKSPSDDNNKLLIAPGEEIKPIDHEHDEPEVALVEDVSQNEDHDLEINRSQVKQNRREKEIDDALEKLKNDNDQNIEKPAEKKAEKPEEKPAEKSELKNEPDVNGQPEIKIVEDVEPLEHNSVLNINESHVVHDKELKKSIPEEIKKINAESIILNYAAENNNSHEEHKETEEERKMDIHNISEISEMKASINEQDDKNDEFLIQ